MPLKPGDVVTLNSDKESNDNDRLMTVEIVDDCIACCVRLPDLDSHPSREIFRVDALHKVEYEEVEDQDDEGD